MPLPIFDTLEAIPESFRAEYEEREDAATPGVKKFHPKVPDVTKLTSALESERMKARTEETARKAAEKERDELKRTQKAKDDGISDEALQKIRADEETARRPFVEEAERLKTENRKLKLDDRALKLFLDKGGRTESSARAMRDLQAQGRLDLSDSGNIVVKDASGTVTTETPEHFFEVTYKAEALEFYKPSGASGGGGTGSITTGPAAGAMTAMEYAAKSNEARAARHNPLLQGKVRTTA